MRTFRSAFRAAVLASVLVFTLGSAGVARAQAIPFDIEVGYRFLTLSGSEESYRSQINEREGFLVRSIHIGEDGKTSGFPALDYLRIDGSDLGAGPAGSLRPDAGLTGAYRLRAPYRHLHHVNALSAAPPVRSARWSVSRPGIAPGTWWTSTSSFCPGRSSPLFSGTRPTSWLAPGTRRPFSARTNFASARISRSTTRSSASAPDSTPDRCRARFSRAGAVTAKRRCSASLRARAPATTRGRCSTRI